MSDTHFPVGAPGDLQDSTGTGTGRFSPGLPSNVPLRARYVDREFLGAATGTFDIWGLACGYDYCDTKKRYMARIVGTAHDDILGTLELWAYTSECCQYPPELPMEFVHAAEFPPIGISKHIKVRLKAGGAKCASIDCVEGYIVHDGTSWKGTIGIIAVELRFNPTNPPNRPFDLSLYSCVGPYPITGTGSPIYASIQVECVFPLKGYAAFGAFDPCCDCPDADNIIEFYFLGHCKRRYAGRYVDILNTGTATYEVWAVSDCCEPCAATVFPCCNYLETCPLQVSFELIHIGGATGTDFSETGSIVGCNCLDGQTFTMTPNVGGHDWANTSFGCPGMTFNMWMDCDPVLVNGVSCCRLTFQMGGGGTNCSCTSTQIVFPDDCDVNPFELEFDLTLVCTDSPPGGNFCCRSFTWRVTITK